MAKIIYAGARTKTSANKTIKQLQKLYPSFKKVKPTIIPKRKGKTKYAIMVDDMFM